MSHEKSNIRIASDGALLFEEVEYNKMRKLIQLIERLWKIN